MQDRPALKGEEQFYWSAFWTLHGDRPVHMGGEGEIPFSAIDGFARRYRVDGLDQFDALRTLVKRMDVTYLKFRADQTTKEGDDG